MKKIFCLIVILMIVCMPLVGCDGTENVQAYVDSFTAGEFGVQSADNPLVELVFASGDTIRVELYPQAAPLSVNNFLTYAKEGFYDNTIFHRVIKDFMIQGGGFAMQGNMPVYKEATHPPIVGEFAANGVPNAVSHRKGVISCARTNAPDSATGQFFICSADCLWLDGQYAAFGRVIDEESMQVVERLHNVATHRCIVDYGNGMLIQADDVPVEAIVLTTVRILRGA